MSDKTFPASLVNVIAAVSGKKHRTFEVVHNGSNGCIDLVYGDRFLTFAPEHMSHAYGEGCHLTAHVHDVYGEIKNADDAAKYLDGADPKTLASYQQL